MVLSPAGKLFSVERSWGKPYSMTPIFDSKLLFKCTDEKELSHVQVVSESFVIPDTAGSDWCIFEYESFFDCEN